MKVADFLDRHRLTGSELSKALGYTGAEAVNSRRRKGEDIPEAWYPRLQELGYDLDGGYTPPPTDDAEELFRDQAPPSPPDDATFVRAASKIDYATLAGHIEGAYTLAADFAIARSDPLLAQVIKEHAQQAGIAWTHYIDSEPRVKAFVERMMIGTPLGEVIGVHAGIFITYAVARATARSIAAEYAQRAAEETPQPGATEAPAEDDLAATSG